MRVWLVALVVACSSAMAEAPFEIEVGVTSDYVYRGLSQNDEDPAVQAGIKFRANDGWYVRGFFSEVESVYGGNGELEFAAGFTRKINNDFSYRAELVYSVFNDEVGGDSDYLEGNFFLDYRDVFTATLGHTADFFGLDEAATYVEGRFNLPLHDVINTALYLGHYSIDGNIIDSYDLVGFDAWTTIGEVEVKMSFTDTDLRNIDNADSRIFVTASYQF